MSGKKEPGQRRGISCGLIAGGVVTFLGVIVSCITIFSFVTGFGSIREMLFGTPVPPQSAPQVIVVTAQASDFASVPTPAAAAAPVDPGLPATLGCQQRAGMLWLQWPDTWYGPYYNGDYIQYGSYGGFYVWDADQLNFYGTLGNWLEYPDPDLQFPRNQWVPLNQSIFSVCIDDLGSVLAVAQ